MHEETCHDGGEDFAPFDESKIPVCVLTENSTYYIQDFKNYFDHQYASLGNFWDYTNKNLKADEVAMAKKINMGKNQVLAIMTFISFNRLCLTNLMSSHDLVQNMKDYLVQLSTKIIDVLLRHGRRVFNYTKVLENKLLRDWDGLDFGGPNVDPPYLFEPKYLLPQLIDAPEKGYEIFDAEDPDRLFSKMAVKLWNCLEHNYLFQKWRNGVPSAKQKPLPQSAASSVLDNGDQLGPVPKKSQFLNSESPHCGMVPTPAIVDDNPAASQKKQGSKNKDSSLDGADNAKPAAHDDTKKKNKRSAKSQQPDDDGADGAPTKKRRIKNAAGAKKPAAPTLMHTHGEFHACFATFLLDVGINRSNLTNTTKNAASLSLMMHKDAVEKLHSEQPHAYRYLTGIDSQMAMLKNNSIPDDVKASVKTHVQDVFKKIQHSFDVQKRALEKKDSQKVVPGMHDCSCLFFALHALTHLACHHRPNEDCQQP
jgi:hypothetical protein